MRYIAEVLKTRSNLAAKSKVQLLPLAAVALSPLCGRVREVNDDLGLGKAISLSWDMKYYFF